MVRDVLGAAGHRLLVPNPYSVDYRQRTQRFAGPLGANQ
jgi:hypothetical protein